MSTLTTAPAHAMAFCLDVSAALAGVSKKFTYKSADRKLNQTKISKFLSIWKVVSNEQILALIEAAVE